MSNSTRPQVPADTSSFTQSMHQALNSIADRDGDISPDSIAEVNGRGPNVTRGGLYTTWEGAMPADGVRRKPISSCATISHSNTTYPEQAEAGSGSASISSTKPLPPTPSSDPVPADGNHSFVPLDPNNSPAKALLNPQADASSGVHHPAPLEPESSPAKGLFDVQSTVTSNTTKPAPFDPDSSPAKNLLEFQSNSTSHAASATRSSNTNGNTLTATSIGGRSTDSTNKDSPAMPSQTNEIQKSGLDPSLDPVIPAVEPTKYGQAYSERNPAPNISTFHQDQEKRHEESQRYFEARQKREDATKAKDDKKRTSTDSDQARAGATNDVPIGGEKSNVLFQPTPSVNFNQVFETLQKDSRQVAYVVLGSVIVLDWLFIGGGLHGFLKSLFPGFGVAAAVYFVLNSVAKAASQANITSEAPKTEKLAYVPESVEWMNSLVETIWHTLQQEFFDGIATQIDDTIKPYIPASVPATVKITELGHGTQSVRIISMRSLPDSEFGDMVPSHGTDKSGSVVEQQAREKAVEREEGGVFYNLEIAVAYHEAPFKTRKEHMHVDILAMLGPIPFPVFIQVKEFVATIRIRLQMHPDLPFLKNVTFALTEKPKVNTSVSFGASWALDLLNLPIIDTVLASQIDAAAADFVQPKSMSLDMTVYIGGSDQKLDTDAIGVLFVKIHRARQLARQDSRGPGADPYLTIAFSKYEKPMYATRIIKGDRNPVWEETAIIMIRAEHVKRNENVLLRLWDSDTTGSDDVSGVCQFPLQELILKSNQMQKREDRLQGDVEGTDAEGVLEWEIGYFPRAAYQKALRTDAKDPRDVHGDKMEVKNDDKSQDAMNTVPDPNLPSGILGLTIHQCINVDVTNPNKKSMGYVKVQGQDSDGEDEGEEEKVDIDYIPSLYCTADINDELVYRTRVKHITNSPTFNSSTEMYVRDWRLATMTLSVWDTRKKSEDCLVGVASLKISDIFHSSSSVVKFYDLKGGEGSGRIRVSMIFRSMQMKLDESLLGYSVGSFVITSPIVCQGNMNSSRLRLRASGSQRSIKESEKKEGGLVYNLSNLQNVLPVHHRYLSPLVLEFIGGSASLTEKLPLVKGMAKKSKHYAIIWLYKLIDNKEQEFVLPVYQTNNPDRLIQNVVYEEDETMQLKQVGEVRFKGKFKAGIDETHQEFLGDHDMWCTYQSWMAARKSGQRTEQATRSTNSTVDELAMGIERSQSIHV